MLILSDAFILIRSAAQHRGRRRCDVPAMADAVDAAPELNRQASFVRTAAGRQARDWSRVELTWRLMEDCTIGPASLYTPCGSARR